MKRHNARRCRPALGALLLSLGLGVAWGCHAEQEREGVLLRVAALLASVPRDSIVSLSAADTLHVSAPTRRFYRFRLYRSAWTDGKTLLPQGKQVYAAIERAGDDGLDPSSYGWDMARLMVMRLDSATLSDKQRAALLGELDLVLTEGFSRYARDLMQGTVDPKKGGLDWRIQRDTTLTENVLDAARNEPVEEVVARLRPTAPHYGRLLGALASCTMSMAATKRSNRSGRGSWNIQSPPVECR